MMGKKEKNFIILFVTICLLIVGFVVVNTILFFSQKQFTESRLYRTNSISRFHFSKEFSNYDEINVLDSFDCRYGMLSVAQGTCLRIKDENSIKIDSFRITNDKSLDIDFSKYKIIAKRLNANWIYYYCFYEQEIEFINVFFDILDIKNASLKMCLNNKEIEIVYSCIEKSIDNYNITYSYAIEEESEINYYYVLTSTTTEEMEYLKMHFFK